MEIKEMPHKCCGGIGGKHKKLLIIAGCIIMLAIIALSIVVAGWKMRELRSNGNVLYGDLGRGQMMNEKKGAYRMPLFSDSNDQFVLPQDALKSGELAIVVNSLEGAKAAVSDVAMKSKGSVYSTFISYASNNIKNGSIVVQIPAENFEKTFGEMKKVGSQVVQETTQQVPLRDFYPMPLTAAEKSVATVSGDDEATATVESADSTIAQPNAPDSGNRAEIAIYPSPIQRQFVQDKGYIRVVFVDYGLTSGGGRMMERNNIGASILGVGNPTNQTMRNNLLVIIGIKLILLVAVFGLLIVILKKIFHRIGRLKKDAARVHIVRQMPKTRARIVRIQKKK